MRHARDALVVALAGFAVGNLALGLVAPALDANWLWLGWAAGRPLDGLAVVALFAVSVLGWRWLPPAARVVARGVVGLVAVAAAVDTVGYFQALAGGQIEATLPVPLSAPMALLFASWAAWPPRPPRLRWPLAAGAVVAAFGIWVTALVGSLASTSYARPADAIVVFGARVYRDGRASQALFDRTRTSCLLYDRGLAGTLVFSGGKSAEAPISEPEAMRRIALAHGVPAAAIVLDELGVNTRASIENTVALGRTHGWDRVLMVSHDYHLARIKLAAARAGLTAFTVPAVESRALVAKPYFFARELAAWVWYWVNPPSL